MTSERRAYGALRDPIEQRGGSMIHVREGYQWGAWIVSLDGKTRTFESNGRGYPELDRLYEPKSPNPQHYNDYANVLLPQAIEKLISMLR